MIRGLAGHQCAPEVTVDVVVAYEKLRACANGRSLAELLCSLFSGRASSHSNMNNWLYFADLDLHPARAKIAQRLVQETLSVLL